jgi:hypothetical protein
MVDMVRRGLDRWWYLSVCSFLIALERAMMPLPTFLPSCCSYNCLDSHVPNLKLNFNLTARAYDSVLVHGQKRACGGTIV